MIESLSSPRCVWSSQATREATHCPPVQLVRTSVRRCNPPKEATGHPRRTSTLRKLFTEGNPNVPHSADECTSMQPPERGHRAPPPSLLHLGTLITSGTDSQPRAANATTIPGTCEVPRRVTPRASTLAGTYCLYRCGVRKGILSEGLLPLDMVQGISLGLRSD